MFHQKQTYRKYRHKHIDRQIHPNIAEPVRRLMINVYPCANAYTYTHRCNQALLRAGQQQSQYS